MYNSITSKPSPVYLYGLATLQQTREEVIYVRLSDNYILLTNMTAKWALMFSLLQTKR